MSISMLIAALVIVTYECTIYILYGLDFVHVLFSWLGSIDFYCEGLFFASSGVIIILWFLFISTHVSISGP
jgi:hypothetical protein